MMMNILLLLLFLLLNTIILDLTLLLLHRLPPTAEQQHHGRRISSNVVVVVSAMSVSPSSSSKHHHVQQQQQQKSSSNSLLTSFQQSNNQNQNQKKKKIHNSNTEDNSREIIKNVQQRYENNKNKRQSQSQKNGSSSSSSSPLIRQQQQQQQQQKKKKIQYVDFWGSTTTSSSTHDDDDDDDDDNPLPCVTNLDPHQLGPLPKGAYYPLLSSTTTTSYSSKSSDSSSITSSTDYSTNAWLYPRSKNDNSNNEHEHESSSPSSMDVCRLALELDFESITSPEQVTDSNDDGWISQLHQCLDAGFTSFQWKKQNNKKNSHRSKQNNLLHKIGQFKQQTPSYIHQHWTVPLCRVPLTITPTSIRNEIGSIIQHTSSETIDTLLINYQDLFSTTTSSSNSDDDTDRSDYYHLDLLDILKDLQRDGYIRSIAVTGMSRHQRLQQIQNGFANLDCIQLQHSKGNLLYPPKTNYDKEEEQQKQKQQTPIWWTDPFGSDDILLLKSCLPDPKNPHRLTQRQIRIIEDWVKGRTTKEEEDPFQYFQDTALEPLQYLALKYQVSQESIILRSTMELAHKQQHRSSLVVPFLLSNSPNTIYHQDNPYIPTISKQIQQLRNVFTFALNEDEEDLEYITEITKNLSRRRNSKNTYINDIIDRDYLIDNIPLDMLEEFNNGNEIPMDLLLEEFHNQNNSDDDDDSEEETNYPEIDFGNKALWL